jgi:SAM-dependent methyltransferase
MSDTALSDIPLTPVFCPLCGADQPSPVTRAKDYVYGVPGEYRYVQCQACRHIYMNPRPADEALMRCYPSEYAPHLAIAKTEDPSSAGQQSAETPMHRRVLRQVPFLKRILFLLGQQHATIIPALPDRSQRRLVEVGCAHGGYLADAAAAGWKVDGIEPDSVAAARARERGFEIRTSTLATAALAEQSREAVVAWMVLEHVPDPLPFVREAFRVLTDGGVFCVSVPNAGGFERRIFGRHWLGYDAPRHLQVFSSRRLKTLLADTGFVEIKVVHQSSIRYWWGSIAAWGLDHRSTASWPHRWMDYFIHELPWWMKWVSLVPENILALLHLSGRITVVARKPTTED